MPRLRRSPTPGRSCWRRSMILVGPVLLLPTAPSMCTPDSESWCEALLEEHGVALTPGMDFDQRDGGAAVRVSLAAGPEAVAAALIRILRFQQSLESSSAP